MSTPTKVTGTSKFSIVNKIVAFFQLGEEGKLSSFFARIHKQLGREIEGLKKTISNAEHNAAISVDEANDRLEDAKEALEESFLQVDVEDVSTNDKQIQHVEVYLGKITRAQKLVTKIEKEVEAIKEKLVKEVEGYQAEIDARNAILASLK